MIANRSKALLPVPFGVLTIPALLELPSPSQPVYFSLIIPTYNESKNILAVVHLLSYLLDEALPTGTSRRSEQGHLATILIKSNTFVTFVFSVVELLVIKFDS